MQASWYGVDNNETLITTTYFKSNLLLYQIKAKMGMKSNILVLQNK